MGLVKSSYGSSSCDEHEHFLAVQSVALILIVDQMAMTKRALSNHIMVPPLAYFLTVLSVLLEK